MGESELFVDRDKPLELGHGLDDPAGALGCGDILFDILLFLQKSFGAQPLYYYGAGVGNLLSLYALVSYYHACPFVYNLVYLKAMPLGYLPVGVAVCGGHAYCSWAKCRIYLFVRYDFNVERYTAKFNIVLFVDKFLVAGIIRMYCNSGIANFGLGAGGRNRDGEVFAVGKCVELGRTFFIYYLVIRDSGLSFGIPVYDTISSINKAVVVHFFKHHAYRKRAIFIECVGLTRPVAGRSHGFDL